MLWRESGLSINGLGTIAEMIGLIFGSRPLCSLMVKKYQKIVLVGLKAMIGSIAPKILSSNW
jgi:hypothetical protein